jgi:prepilin-type N-terminal cleavage/methylation domain-containing protein
MSNMTAIKKNDAGVTLIELMIVLVIATFLVAGIYSLFITQHRSYTVQDQVAGVQQDARAALDIMTRDIRMAGFVAGAGSVTGFTDGTTSSITIPSNPPTGYPYYYAFEPRNSTTGPDTLSVVLGAIDLGVVQGVTGNSITLASAATSNPTFFSFDLLPGRLYQGTVAGTIITIASVGFPSGSSKIVGGKAYGVQAITYAVGADGVLRRNTNTSAFSNQPLAGDVINTIVEDLQYAYQVQGNTANWFNTPAEAGATNADIRMVRINITVRPAVQDASVQAAPSSAQFNQPALEDHTAGLSGPDGFRRRVYTTVVKVRNLY